MSAILAIWSYQRPHPTSEIVLPDGCRDLIIVRPRGARPFCFLYDFDTAPREVEIPADQRMTGYRLRPSARIDGAALIQRAAARIDDPAAIPALIDESCVVDEELDAAIRGLSEGGKSVPEIAREIGVTARTLQRRLRGLNMPPPEYWSMLGRARRAVSLIAEGIPLSEAAHAAHYSDQAHMTREFRRWFNATPARLQADADLRRDLLQPGLATAPTGVQISTV